MVVLLEPFPAYPLRKKIWVHRIDTGVRGMALCGYCGPEERISSHSDGVGNPQAVEGIFVR